MKTPSTIRELPSTPNTTAKPHHHAVLRGGRLRKAGRGVATHAPCPGKIAVAATGAGMTLSAGNHALAQSPADSCVVTMTDTENDDVVCSGMVTTTRNCELLPDDIPRIADTSGFTANVAAGNAFHITGSRNSGGLDLTLTGIVAAAAGHGACVFHNVSEHASEGLSVTTAGVTAGLDGIPIRIASAASHIEITTIGDITAGRTCVHAIRPNSHGERITVAAGGSVTNTDTGNGQAVPMTGGLAQTLVPNPGAGSFTGTVTESGSGFGAVLEPAGESGSSGRASLDLAQLSDFTNFHDIDKTGTGTRELTGAQGGRHERVRLRRRDGGHPAYQCGDPPLATRWRKSAAASVSVPVFDSLEDDNILRDADSSLSLQQRVPPSRGVNPHHS